MCKSSKEDKDYNSCLCLFSNYAILAIVLILLFRLGWLGLDAMFGVGTQSKSDDSQLGNMISLLGIVITVTFGVLGFLGLKTFSDITKKIKEESRLREVVGQAHQSVVKELIDIQQEMDGLKKAVARWEFLDDPSLDELFKEAKNNSIVSKYKRKSIKTKENSSGTVYND